MRKLWIAAIILLCVFSLILSLFFFFVWNNLPEKSAPSYILKDWGGHLALFHNNDIIPFQVYEEVYTHLLPQTDVEELRRGIPLYSEDEIDRILEDFGA